MPRLRILNATEREAYDKPPVLNTAERRRAFDLPGVCSGYVRFFITSAQHRAVADTFDDVPDYTAPGLGTDTPMNIAHA
jgi:hypothetical protein